jgi:FAD/FMN-containing dehydrogenase
MRSSKNTSGIHLDRDVRGSHQALPGAARQSPIVGRVGDGNFHCSLLRDVDDRDEMRAARTSCTGEHDIGQGKQKYLKAELNPAAIDAMRALKQALDLQNIFNLGKDLAGGEGPLCHRSSGW